jgi:RluA family pseudouridine synthase
VNIPVVYEDNWLLVVNKPSGLITISAPGKQRRTLLKILNEDFKNKASSYHLYPCHRLDQQTSGLIIFAKGKKIQKIMMQEFKERRVDKTYLAFVYGRPSRSQGYIKNPVYGRPAVTRYEVIGGCKDFSVVKVQPLTGRKNQIRIHFKQIGYPVVGEDKFAFRRDFKIKAKRLCLHAQGLNFRHPATKQSIRLKIGLPEYLKEFLKT